MNWLGKLVGGNPPNILPVKLTGHEHLLRCVAVSPDGRRVLTGGEVKLRDVVSGKEIRTLKAHAGDLFALAVFPDKLSSLFAGRSSTRRPRNFH